MLWSSVDDFVVRTVEFVLDGLRAGEPVMVALPLARLTRVRTSLGSDADSVVLADMESLGANPARIIAAWLDFLESTGGAPSRGVGEPLWAGRRRAEVQECHLHEALLNDAVPADTPLWLRCPYEVGALPSSVVDEALCSHPWLAQPDGTARANESYGGGELGAASFTTPLQDPPKGSVVRPITWETAGELAELGSHAARVCGVGPERAADLGLALHELGVNTIVHGSGEGVLRLWREPGALVCQVSDTGVVTDPLAGRLTPSVEETDGRGLWMVNQLCDLVQLRSSSAGTTVRVHTWL